MISGRTFDEILDHVHARADRMLPDRVVHVSDLRMTPAGHLHLPDGATFRLNDHARRNLSAQVGVRWSTWFSGAISGDERADEMNRRLSRSPGEMKIRAWKDDTREADGVARALVSPRFSAIDDARLFDRLNATMRSALAEYRFTRMVETDETTHYTALHVEPRDLHGDVHHPGWNLRNSEVGAAALTLDDLFFRVACSNGLLIEVDGKRLFYRTHRAIDDDHLAAAMVIALSRLPQRWTAVTELLLRARDQVVPHPDAAVAAVLDLPTVPRSLVAEAQTLALRDGNRTRYAVTQAITFVAHAKNADPDVRFAMERAAGAYLAAA